LFLLGLCQILYRPIFESTHDLLSAFCLLLTLGPWRWKEYDSLKCLTMDVWQITQCLMPSGSNLYKHQHKNLNTVVTLLKCKLCWGSN
jgi:hypothetical protein